MFFQTPATKTTAPVQITADMFFPVVVTTKKEETVNDDMTIKNKIIPEVDGGIGFFSKKNGEFAVDSQVAIGKTAGKHVWDGIKSFGSAVTTVVKGEGEFLRSEGQIIKQSREEWKEQHKLARAAWLERKEKAAARAAAATAAKIAGV